MNFRLLTTSQIQKIGLAIWTLLFCSAITFAQDKTAAGLYNEGLAMLKEKNYEAGLPLLEEALVLAETDANEKVIRLAKKNGAVAAYNVGNAKRKAGATDEAMVLYEKGIALNPEYGSNYTGVAMCVEKGGDKIATINAYIKAGDMNAAKPDRAGKMYKKAQNTVGKLYTSKDYDTAIAGGQAFLAARPDNADVNYYVARAMIEKGDNEAALVHADNAVTLATAAASIQDKFYIAKAKALENLKRMDEAIAAYKMVTDEKYLKQAKYKIETLGTK